MASTNQQIQEDTEEDIFSSALNLETAAYEAGYAEGVADGERAGRNQGRIFGLTQGYDRFLELGRMQGRGDLWASQMSSPNAEQSLENNPRIKKHINTLLELTDPEHSPALNTEEAVEAFEERIKRARAKVKLVEKILGEETTEESYAEVVAREDAGVRLTSTQVVGRERNIEDL